MNSVVLYYKLIPHFKIFPICRQATVQSDPGVRSLDRKPYCSLCKSEEHFTRGCKARFPGPAGREDAVLVDSFLTSRQDEPEEQRGLLNTLWQ